MGEKSVTEGERGRSWQREYGGRKEQHRTGQYVQYSIEDYAPYAIAHFPSPVLLLFLFLLLDCGLESNLTINSNVNAVRGVVAAA